MKTFRTLFAGILAAGMLAGCSKSEVVKPEGGGESDPNAAVYMSVDINLPATTGTRAGAGEEQGKDYENKVQKLLLVLARTDGSYTAHGIVDNLTISGKTVTTTAKISRTDIQRFYADGDLTSGKNKIRVFAICNPTDEMIETLDKTPDKDRTWYDKIGEATDKGTDAGIWTRNYFLMTNAEIDNKQIPEKFDDWRTMYSSEVTPFNLSGPNNNGGGIDNGSPIKIERVAARFDFKDGSKNGDTTYDIGLGDDAGKLQVKLIRMALVNMNKTFYYMRRTSADGTNANSVLGGSETTSNYVVSTEEEFKTASTIDAAAASQKFFFPLYNTQGKINDDTRQQWDSYWIDDVLGNTEDNDEGWNAAAKTGYRIWRYVTENTIPGDASNQRTGITTGVVFKGKLEVATDDEHYANLKRAVDGEYVLPEKQGYTYQVDGKTYPILYLFQNQIFVGWNDEITKFISTEEGKKSDLYLAATAKDADAEGHSLDDLYQALVKANTDGDKNATDAALAAFRKAATAKGFTLYQASNDAEGIADGGRHDGVGYYFYYYYWNRHNDNGMPSTMGKMEFGVVRNNVYKLAVTGISKLGHPRITDNDPDPEDPDTPDEKGDVYLTVSVEVLPWTVKVNNIDL